MGFPEYLKVGRSCINPRSASISHPFSDTFQILPTKKMLSTLIAPLSWNAAALPASASARRARLPIGRALLWACEVGRWAEA